MRHNLSLTSDFIQLLRDKRCSLLHFLFLFIFVSPLFKEGFKEAAEKFRMESGIEPSVDLDSLDERIKIREMILKGQIQEAIALINSLHPELLDTNRYLYFHLQVHVHSAVIFITSSDDFSVCLCEKQLVPNYTCVMLIVDRMC